MVHEIFISPWRGNKNKSNEFFHEAKIYNLKAPTDEIMSYTLLALLNVRFFEDRKIIVPYFPENKT